MSALRLTGDMTIYEAAAQCVQVLEALERRKDLEIDLSGVTALDTAGLQLLILAKKTASAQGGSLRLTGHSPAVVDAFDLLQLGQFFGDQIVIHP
jgi:anti-anti-sigma factor